MTARKRTFYGFAAGAYVLTPSERLARVVGEGEGKRLDLRYIGAPKDPGVELPPALLIPHKPSASELRALMRTRKKGARNEP